MANNHWAVIHPQVEKIPDIGRIDGDQSVRIRKRLALSGTTGDREADTKGRQTKEPPTAWRKGKEGKNQEMLLGGREGEGKIEGTRGEKRRGG